MSTIGPPTFNLRLSVVYLLSKVVVSLRIKRDREGLSFLKFCPTGLKKLKKMGRYNQVGYADPSRWLKSGKKPPPWNWTCQCIWIGQPITQWASNSSLVSPSTLLTEERFGMILFYMFFISFEHPRFLVGLLWAFCTTGAMGIQMTRNRYLIGIMVWYIVYIATDKYSDPYFRTIYWRWSNDEVSDRWRGDTLTANRNFQDVGRKAEPHLVTRPGITEGNPCASAGHREASGKRQSIS